MLSLRDIDELEKGRKESKTLIFKPTLKPRDNKRTDSSIHQESHGSQSAPASNHEISAGMAMVSAPASSIEQQHPQLGDRAAQELHISSNKRFPAQSNDAHLRLGSSLHAAPLVMGELPRQNQQQLRRKVQGVKQDATSIQHLDSLNVEAPHTLSSLRGQQMPVSAGQHVERPVTTVVQAKGTSDTAVTEELDLPRKRERRFVPATLTDQNKQQLRAPSVSDIPAVSGSIGSRLQDYSHHVPVPSISSLDPNMMHPLGHRESKQSAGASDQGDSDDGEIIKVKSKVLRLASRQKKSASASLVFNTNPVDAEKGKLASSLARKSNASASGRKRGRSEVVDDARLRAAAAAAAAAVAVFPEPLSSIHLMLPSASTPPRRRPRKPSRAVDPTVTLKESIKSEAKNVSKHEQNVSLKPRHQRKAVLIGTDDDALHAVKGIRAAASGLGLESMDDQDSLGNWIGGILEGDNQQKARRRSSGKCEPTLGYHLPLIKCH